MSSLKLKEKIGLCKDFAGTYLKFPVAINLLNLYLLHVNLSFAECITLHK